MDQRFRGNAADIETHTADKILFDHRGREAELGSADRRHVAAGASTDNDKIILLRFHVDTPFPLFLAF